jgi:hypothetical protein
LQELVSHGLDQPAVLAEVLRSRLAAKQRKLRRFTEPCLLVLEVGSILLDLGQAADAIRECGKELRAFEHVLVVETGATADPPWFLHAAQLAGHLITDHEEWRFENVSPVDDDRSLLTS